MDEPRHEPEPTLEGYGGLVAELQDLDIDELRERARAKGLDGVEQMSREQLMEKLADEPGANEI